MNDIKVIKLSAGEATLKTVATYALRKRMNAALFKGVNVQMGRDAIAAVPFDNIESQKTVAILGLVEKVVWNGQEMSLTADALEALPVDDYELIANAAMSIVNPPIEQKKT